MGSVENPTFINDDTRVKSLFVLGKPTDSTEELGALFDNQLLTLCSVIEADLLEQKATKTNITFKEWTSHAGSDTSGDPDYINVVSEAMYVAPKSGATLVGQSRKEHALTERTHHGKTATSSTPAAPTIPTTMQKKEVSKGTGKRSKNVKTTNDVTTNDVYRPTVLHDYGGDLFKHVNSKLRQLDF
ncbi:hypothetical protein JVT61DRAFT_7277 [Boletus reticuloceps]|uniref:Uncharacterized protein n=1 Tax=Boletus reticuloceps TaxID=495285 RepID=A0A8I2YJQ7_9AGAM|nr:hypothetical protein JVT61DRAFT_7277 [Boletus reticuloceps]